jgi:hypothetical protein
MVVQEQARLTVSFGAEVLTTAGPALWCQGKVAEVLGPQASRKPVARLADSLTEHAGFFASQHVTKGAAYFYPDFTRLTETELPETELPAGPALRVHRFRKMEPVPHREQVDWIIGHPTPPRRS